MSDYRNSQDTSTFLPKHESTALSEKLAAYLLKDTPDTSDACTTTNYDGIGNLGMKHIEKHMSFLNYSKAVADKIIEENKKSREEIEELRAKMKNMKEIAEKPKAKIVSNHLIGELLVEGFYCKIKECIDLKTLARRAVKIINLEVVARKIPRGVENVRNEISIMRRLNHKNVIRMYSTFENVGQTLKQEQLQSSTDGKRSPSDMDKLLVTPFTMLNIQQPPKMYIFMDYCITSLEKLLKTAPRQRLCNWQANHYFRQICEGLDYLHSLNIIHNNIKPDNLLINCENTLKICDFSISAALRVFWQDEYAAITTSSRPDCYDLDKDGIVNPGLFARPATRFPILQCTPMFQCPEMLDEGIDQMLILEHAPKIDVWSTGITLFLMTTGKLPFEGHIHQIFDSIRSDAYQIPIPDWADKNLRELLTNMLHRDPVRRWSLKQVRECDWFRKKHSFIREDLTSLPKEIIQKEHATFSMSPNLIMLYQKRADQLTIDLNNYLKISLENVPDHHGTAPNTQPPFHSANIKELSQATKKERSKKSCALM